MAWTVQLTDDAKKELIADFKSGVLTREDSAIMKKWVAEVEEYGIEEVQRKPAWRDHELVRGKWAGHRAISISYQGRLIYKIENETITVMVVKVTHDHDYS